MTVAELLRNQRGWGPTRSANVLRSVSLSEKKTLGSLTERQRVMLAAVLVGAGEKLTPLRRLRFDPAWMRAEASGVIVSLASFVLIECQEEACWTWRGGRSC